MVTGLHYPTRLAMTSHFSHQHKELKMPKELGSEFALTEDSLTEEPKVKRKRVKKENKKKNVTEEISNKENQVNDIAIFRLRYAG